MDGEDYTKYYVTIDPQISNVSISNNFLINLDIKIFVLMILELVKFKSIRYF